MSLSKIGKCQMMLMAVSEGEEVTAEQYPGDTLYYVLEGVMPLHRDGKIYEMTKSQIAVVPQGVEHAIGGKGDFKIENSGKNSCLMKVRIAISGESVYETDYIKPNQHINEDMLSKLPPVGEYDADVTFEAFDPSTEASLGTTGMKIKIVVVK